MSKNRHKRTLRDINVNSVNGAMGSDHITFFVSFIILFMIQ